MLQILFRVRAGDHQLRGLQDDPRDGMLVAELLMLNIRYGSSVALDYFHRR